jgi:hypothetical protein
MLIKYFERPKPKAEHWKSAAKAVAGIAMAGVAAVGAALLLS